MRVTEELPTAVARIVFPLTTLLPRPEAVILVFEIEALADPPFPRAKADTFRPVTERPATDRLLIAEEAPVPRLREPMAEEEMPRLEIEGAEKLMFEMDELTLAEGVRVTAGATA